MFVNVEFFVILSCDGFLLGSFDGVLLGFYGGLCDDRKLPIYIIFMFHPFKIQGFSLFKRSLSTALLIFKALQAVSI